MASVLSNYGGNTALSAILGVGGYAACHTSDPTVTGLAASEVAGGGYVRQPVKFSAPGSKTTASTNALIFPGMPACTVTYLAVWTAISGGNMIYAVLLGTPIVVLESGQLLAAVGDLALSL